MMNYRSQLVPPHNIICLCLLFVFMFIQTGNAQDRMPAIPESEMTEEQLAAVDEFKQVRNTTRFGGPFVALLVGTSGVRSRGSDGPAKRVGLGNCLYS